MNVIMATERPNKRKSKSLPAPERVRLIFDTTDILRRAIAHRANKEGVRRRRKVSATELLNELLEALLREEIREVEEPSDS
jgi:hypothetical protein